MSASAIRVLVAEDQALIRGAFSSLVRAQHDMVLNAAVDNGSQAVAAAHRADVVLMDIRMPVLDGIEATRRIVSSGGPPVLILTTFREENVVLSALQAGAAGFLLKDSEPPTLLAAVRSLVGGEGFIDPQVTPMVLRNLHHDPAPPAGPPNFTARENDVLQLVCEGLSNSQIARRLVVAETTVKTHVKNLLAKTGTTNRVTLVIWAAKQGLF